MEDFFAGAAAQWPAGREDYQWMVLPGTRKERERLAGQYRDLAGWPGLVPAAAEHMHIGVQHPGPVTAIRGMDVARMTRLVRGRCAGIGPFPVTAGRAEAWEATVACPVRPGYFLRFLRQVIIDVSRDVTASPPDAQPAAYYPYLTVAHAVGHVDQGSVRAWISDCEAAEVTLPVTGLVLAAARHDGREITWRIIDEVPLASTAP
jgi:hypothetical protein